MGAVWTITRKDLVLRLRDRSVLLYGIVAPLVLAAVLGGVFGNVEESITIDLVVVAEDGGQLSDGFVQDVLPALVADGLVTDVEESDDRDAARAAVESGARTAAVVFRAGSAAGPGDIEVVGNVDTSTGTAVTEAVVEAYAREARVVGTTLAAGAAVGVTDADALVGAARSAAPTLTLADEPVGFVPVDIVTYLAGGMSVFFLFFAAGIAVTGLLEEQRDRTLARLLTAPIPAWAPLAAKALTAVIVGTVSMAVLVVATGMVIGAHWGDPAGVAVLVVAAVLAATGVVAVVASFARTPESASSALGVVGTVLGALGGAFFPLPATGILAVVRTITPHHWFLQGVRRLSGGGAVEDITGPVAALLAMAVVTAVVAGVRLRPRVGV